MSSPLNATLWLISNSSHVWGLKISMLIPGITITRLPLKLSVLIAGGTTRRRGLWHIHEGCRVTSRTGYPQRDLPWAAPCCGFPETTGPYALFYPPLPDRTSNKLVLIFTWIYCVVPVPNMYFNCFLTATILTVFYLSAPCKVPLGLFYSTEGCAI